MSGAQAAFIAGTAVVMAGGGLHAAQALRDTVHPRAFTPVDRSVEAAMEGTGLRLVRRTGGRGDPSPSMWSVWLGVHIGFGLGIFTVGLLCLVIAIHDFGLVEHIAAIRPLAIAFSAAFLALSLRFFFYVPVLITGAATACFTLAAVLSG